MKETRLPSLIKLRTEANRRSDYSGVYPKDKFTRLKEFVISIDKDITTNFSCGFDVSNRVVAKGTATTTVTLLCMRCHREFQYELQAEFNFTPVVSDEQAASMPDEYIPLLVNEFDEVDMLEAIEDELIVNIPLNPMMPESECNLSASDYVFGDDFEEDEVQDVEEQTSKSNPFAILESLKKDL